MTTNHKSNNITNQLTYTYYNEPTTKNSFPNQSKLGSAPHMGSETDTKAEGLIVPLPLPFP
jgi:hypothetical protein